MSDLQAALDWWDAEGQHIRAGMWQGLDTIVNAARKYAKLTESGPVPASQCVFPLVKEDLLVYPTDQRRSYGITPENTPDEDVVTVRNPPRRRLRITEDE